MADKKATDVTTAQSAIAPWQKIHELTGEIVSKFKYLEGHPRQYRFDAKEGVFSINGTEKIGRTITFQPIALRIFTDAILGMGTKNWAEVFFIDEKNCVASLLFHGYSVDNIFRLIEPLYYEDLTLADVVITATAEKKENTKIQPKGVYYIANFTYKMAEAEATSTFKDFAKATKIYRQETLTDVANIKTTLNYYNPLAHAEEVEALPEGVTNRELNQAVEQHYQQESEVAADQA